MEELKPCPFCGEKEDLDDWECDEGPAIRCLNCGAIGPWMGTHKEARQEWNNRNEKIGK